MACTPVKHAYGNYKTTCIDYHATEGANGSLAGICHPLLLVRDL